MAPPHINGLPIVDSAQAAGNPLPLTFKMHQQVPGDRQFGEVHTNGPTEHHQKNGIVAKDGASSYRIRESPMGTKRKLKVAFMGMGASGINFAYQIGKMMPDVDLVVYEKNYDVGGTWLENRYPGCACDIPSVCYQFTWQRKPDWSQYYSGANEIFDYFKWVAESNDLLKYVKFNHTIVSAEWQEADGKWKITIMRNNDPNDIFDDYADFFVNGGGVLNKWRWPKIEGLHDFKGPLLHSARWKEDADVERKKVLVIGVGSSGVQIIPKIIDKVDQLFVVARSSIWVTAGFAPHYAGPQGENFEYSEKTKQRFRDDPTFYLSYCKAIESELSVRFKFMINGSEDAIEARKYATQEMTRKLAKKPELAAKLIPSDFNVGCRRPTPGNGFLEALTDDKTQLITGLIQKVTPTGYIDANGNTQDVDMIICATGFDTSFRPAFPVICNGFNLQDEYEKSVVGYLGLSAPEVPNYFIFIGPYGPLGHGSTIPMIEAYTNYVMQVMQKVQVEDIKKIEVKRSVAEDFTTHSDLYLERTAWSGPCSSWFKNGVSKARPLCWPGSRVHYLEILQKPRFEDFDIEYQSGNRWNFLGDGFDVREFDGRDLTWYYGLLDDEDKQPASFPTPLF
jgi:cation diffusion facilitator CzcD-associated flavoprotein CzcO